MTDENDPEIIYSDLSCEVELEGHLLTVEIYKSEINPEWILEVVNEHGTSTVWDIPFIADGMAWRAFENAVKEEGLEAFLGNGERKRVLH